MREKLKLAVMGGGVNSAVGTTHLIASTMDFKAEIVGGFFSRDKSINFESGKRAGLKDNCLFSSVDELIENREKFDLVLLLTPTDDHYEHLKVLLNAKLNVICEKSLVLNSAQAEEIQKITQENGNFLSVIYNYTGYPMIREMRELILSDKIGEVCHFSIQMPQQSFVKKSVNGKVSEPQTWRLVEKEFIPKVSLDLGVHVVNLMRFLINKKLESVYCVQSCFGEFSGIVDFVSSTVQMEGGALGQLIYGKSFLGEDNGLEVKIYGKKGSLAWKQISCETILFTDDHGEGKKITSSSNNLITAGEKRYHRFKPGHPTGFIESFANHYSDIYKAYNFRSKGEGHLYSYGAETAINDLKILELFNRSATSSSVVLNSMPEGALKNVS